MFKDGHKNYRRHLFLSILQLFGKGLLMIRRLGVLDVQLETIHDRLTQMALELVPVESNAMMLGFKVRWYQIHQKSE